MWTNYPSYRRDTLASVGAVSSSLVTIVSWGVVTGSEDWVEARGQDGGVSSGVSLG